MRSKLSLYVEREINIKLFIVIKRKNSELFAYGLTIVKGYKACV